VKFVISFMADSEVTEIIVTAANIVYGVRHDAAGNVRTTTKAAKNHQRAVSNRNVAFKTLFNGLALNITTAIFNNWIDGCSDAQEGMHIDKAAKRADEMNMLVQSNESVNSTFMGIVANIT